MTEGSIEYELGVPIPGRILPRADWARTAVKRLPEAGSARLAVDLRTGGADRSGPRLRQRPVHPAECREPAGSRPLRRRHPAGRDPIRHPAGQPPRPAQRPIRRQGRRDVPRASHVPAASVAEVHLYHPQPYHDHRQSHRRVLTPHFLADVHRVLVAGWPVLRPDRQPGLLGLHHVASSPSSSTGTSIPAPGRTRRDGRTRREILARGRGLADLPRRGAAAGMG